MALQLVVAGVWILLPFWFASQTPYPVKNGTFIDSTQNISNSSTHGPCSMNSTASTFTCFAANASNHSNTTGIQDKGIYTHYPTSEDCLVAMSAVLLLTIAYALLTCVSILRNEVPGTMHPAFNGSVLCETRAAGQPDAAPTRLTEIHLTQSDKCSDDGGVEDALGSKSYPFAAFATLPSSPLSATRLCEILLRRSWYRVQKGSQRSTTAASALAYLALYDPAADRVENSALDADLTAHLPLPRFFCLAQPGEEIKGSSSTSGDNGSTLRTQLAYRSGDVVIVAVPEQPTKDDVALSGRSVGAKTIFVRVTSQRPTPAVDAFTTAHAIVRGAATALGRDVVPLLERADRDSAFIPVLKHTNGREIHVFLTSEDGVEAAVWNAPAIAYVHSIIAQALPRTDINLGARLASALTDAIDDVSGSGEKVTFSAATKTFTVVPSKVAVPVAANAAPSVDVTWKIYVERCWDEGCSDFAYVLEFVMQGIPKGSPARQALEEQLQWGKGIKMERRGRAACETLSVVARGPDGQRLRAYTELQEHNVGEAEAPVSVLISDSGVVRIQFYPGQIDE